MVPARPIRTRITAKKDQNSEISMGLAPNGKDGCGISIDGLNAQQVLDHGDQLPRTNVS
jgi:hypothetical protein